MDGRGFRYEWKALVNELADGLNPCLESFPPKNMHIRTGLWICPSARLCVFIRVCYLLFCPHVCSPVRLFLSRLPVTLCAINMRMRIQLRNILYAFASEHKLNIIFNFYNYVLVI